MMYETLSKCDICANPDIAVLDKQSSISRCFRCGYVFDNPRPKQQEIVDYYSRSDKYNEWIEEEYARDVLWNRRLRKMKKYAMSGTLLDVGTGIGQFLHHARSHFTEVYGTEVSDSAVDIARSKYGLKVLKGSLENIDFKGVTFDNISLFHVLEHVLSPKQVITTCHSLLNKNGVLFVAVPNDLFLIEKKMSRLRRCLGFKASEEASSSFQKIRFDGTMPEIHLSHFTPTTLKYLLANSGFQILEMSLDPAYAASGLRRVVYGVHYYVHSLLSAIARYNFYSTIWIVAKKNECKDVACHSDL